MNLRATIALVALLSALVHAAPAVADEDGRARAESLYADGLRLLQQGHAERALVALDESAQLLPSPNTDLLRAHALRSLRRRADAMVLYERVVRDAGARLRGGEARYEPTLAEAGRWVAFLRNELAELALELRVGGQKFAASVNGEPIEPALDPSTGIARIRLWREPGKLLIRVRAQSGPARMREIEIAAGASRSVTFDLTPPTAPAPSPSPKAQPQDVSHAPPLASFIAWGIGGAGLVTFAVAGGLAKSQMNELDECRPRCTQEQTDDAETKATIANVGLAVGVIAVVTGGAIWLGSEATRPAPGMRAGVAISRRDAGLTFSGSF